MCGRLELRTREMQTMASCREASHLAACRGSRVCFASYLAFHFSVKSLGGARDIVLVRATVARERSMFQTMFSALLPISSLSIVQCCELSFRSPRLARWRVPSQLGDLTFGTGNSHFGVDGQMAAVVLRYLGKRHFCGLHSSPTFGLSFAEEFYEQEQFFLALVAVRN